MRVYLLYLVIASLAIYAWKDWYKALCGLILLLAVIEHPEMPKGMMGIQGLNPWNILLLIIVMAWVAKKNEEGLRWDMPRHISILLLIYMVVMIISFLRILWDPSGLNDYAFLRGLEASSMLGLWSEYFINTLKWIIPGLLLFSGCNSRSRFALAAVAIAGIYFLLSIQVIKWMLPSMLAGGSDITVRSMHILRNEVGYHRTDISLMLAGGGWALLSLQEWVGAQKKLIIIIGAGVVLGAQMLTAGRGGYMAWAVVGLVLCGLRWRKILFIAPILVILLVTSIPQLHNRLFEGFGAGKDDVYQTSETDLYVVTAGRNVVWPLVLDKIGEAPLLGYGRLAMQRTGISAQVWEEHHDSAPHPHNAYLQLLFDNGWIGALPIFLFYLVIIKYSISLFMDSHSPVFVVVGGMAFSLVGALLVGSITGQTFYPREANAGMWASIGLMLRVWVERAKILKAPQDHAVEDIDRKLWGEVG